MVTDVFYKFNLAENQKLVFTEAREKLSAYLKFLEFWKFIDVCFTKFKKHSNTTK